MHLEAMGYFRYRNIDIPTLMIQYTENKFMNEFYIIIRFVEKFNRNFFLVEYSTHPK